MASCLLGSALALTAACSLRSLDHLGAGEASGAAGAGGTTEMGAAGGAAAGASGAAAAAGASGAAAAAGASGAAAGASGAMDEAGAGGSEPGDVHCTDQETTGDETDVDCGGRTCGPCSAGQKCVTGSDCQSAVCGNETCRAPTCTDLALNGNETDLDCGGACPVCPEGRHCASDDDCSTTHCQAGICEPPPCMEGVLQKGCPLLVDNVPYSLSPSNALTNCIDGDVPLVIEGNPMVLHPCGNELEQTFWAIEQANGYFSFRNALSGKCLRVRDASPTAGAVIEQSTCSNLADQLWKPSLFDSSLMRLTSQSSGLLLDVAGTNASRDGRAVVQGEADTSGNTEWRVARRTTASYVTLSPNADRTIRIRHDGDIVTLTADNETSAHWLVVPGLNDPWLVSFQSRNNPERYLRHTNYRLRSDVHDGSTQFKQDATFRYVNPFVGADPLAKGLEASNFPGYFLRRDGANVTLAPLTDTPEYKDAATWQLVAR